MRGIKFTVFRSPLRKKSTMNLATHRPSQNISRRTIPSCDFGQMTSWGSSIMRWPPTISLQLMDSIVSLLPKKYGALASRLHCRDWEAMNCSQVIPCSDMPTNWIIRSCVSLFGLCHLLHDAFGQTALNSKNWLNCCRRQIHVWIALQPIVT